MLAYIAAGAVTVIAVSVAAAYMTNRFLDRREQRRDTEARLRRALFSDTAEFDIVDQAFEDYQRSVADILDANPTRRDDLIRGLEAATAEWEDDRFRQVVGPFRRDLRFRLAVRRATRRSTTI